jgi:hypothetical protein
MPRGSLQFSAELHELDVQQSDPEVDVLVRRNTGLDGSNLGWIEG